MTFDAERDLHLTDCQFVTENEYAKVHEYTRLASNKGGKIFFRQLLLKIRAFFWQKSM